MKERDIVVLSETAEDEALLDKAEFALSQARSATKNIKYDDSALNIMIELGTIVDELGVKEVKKELEYLENAVREANNNLESAVYGLEEPFEDLISTLRNKIEDEEMDRDEQEWQDQQRREQEQENKLVVPNPKGKKILDHIREPLVDNVTLLDPAIDAEFINWIKEKRKSDPQFPLGDIRDPKELLRLKQEYNKETDHWAGDGGNLRHGTPHNRRSRQEEGKLDGYYLDQDAMKLWLKDNPGATERDWGYIGVDVSDEYTEKVGGIKGRYLGKGASEWTRRGKKDTMDHDGKTDYYKDRIRHGRGKKRIFSSEADEVDYKNMGAGEFAKAHGDQWDLSALKLAAEVLHDLVEPILDSFESREEIESYMSQNMPTLGRDYDSEEAIEQAFELLSFSDDSYLPTENTKNLKEPILSGRTKPKEDKDDWASEILARHHPNRLLKKKMSGNEEKVADLIRSALTDPKGADVYELFAELESINPELAELYKDVALYQYDVQIGESLEEVKRWQAIAAAVAILAGLWGVNNKLAQTAYDNSPQLQELIQLLQTYENTPGEKAEDYVDQLEDRIRKHEFRIDIGKGEVMGPDGQPIQVVDPGEEERQANARAHRAEVERLTRDTERDQALARRIPKLTIPPNRGPNEAQRPTTSSVHSTTKDIKKYDPAHGHTHPEGGNPQVCPKCKGKGCSACGYTGEVISKLRNDPTVESLKWKPGSDKKSWWDK